jgi:hypothetical protein
MWQQFNPTWVSSTKTAQPVALPIEGKMDSSILPSNSMSPNSLLSYTLQTVLPQGQSTVGLHYLAWMCLIWLNYWNLSGTFRKLLGKWKRPKSTSTIQEFSLRVTCLHKEQRWIN